MEFSLEQSLEVLSQTPQVLEAYLSHLSPAWLHGNEGPETWSPYEVLAHLIVGEQTDWLARINIIMSDSEDKRFKPFDRFAHLNQGEHQPIAILLQEFRALRTKNLVALKALNIHEADLSLTGMHPEFGIVTLQQLIATWAVHDLGHIAQISRVMAKQYREAVGPWSAYLGILKK